MFTVQNYKKSSWQLIEVSKMFQQIINISQALFCEYEIWVELRQNNQNFVAV